MQRLLMLVLIAAGLMPLSRVQGSEPQVRAVWVDAFHPGIKSAAETDQLLRDVQRLGANTLLVQIRRRGDSYARRGKEPVANDVAANYDPLADLIAKAHRQGLQVHGWVTTLPIWHDGYQQTDPSHVWYRHGLGTKGRDNWLNVRDDGGAGDCNGPGACDYFLDPAHPDAATYTVSVLLALAQSYDLDGLHLDYLRYPSAHFGYNATSLQRFQQETGRSDRPRFDDPQWMQWRRDQVTLLLRRIALNVLAAKPRMQLSLAAIAWGDAPHDGDFHQSAAYARTLQDWDAWLDKGYLDWLAIMNYEDDAQGTQRQWYRDWVDWVASHHGDRRVAIGIGAWLNTPDAIMSQLRYAVDAGVTAGAALYSYGEPAQGSRLQVYDRVRNEQWNDAAPAVGNKRDGQSGNVLGKLTIDGVPQTNATVWLRAPNQPDIAMTTDGSGVFGAVRVPAGAWSIGSDGVANKQVDVRPGTVTSLDLSGSKDLSLRAGSGDPAFNALWQRTDQAVADGKEQRSWLWGPRSFAVGSELYQQSPASRRAVMYWDKSRMEVTQPEADRNAQWFITNGLLVREMVSGEVQIGDAETITRAAAHVPVGGNSDDTTLGPSYDTFAPLASLHNDHRSERTVGAPVNQTIDAAGRTGTDWAVARYGVTEREYNTALGHTIPDVFSDYFHKLPLDWVFVMGYPISDAYWTKYRVGDRVQDVLVQLYERRTLTYTPANPAAYQVEMGNVGQHYYQWRYGSAPWAGR